MYIYVISFGQTGYDDKVSAEAYRSLQSAHNFIEGRSDKPRKINDYLYESDTGYYRITEVKIVQELE